MPQQHKPRPEGLILFALGLGAMIVSMMQTLVVPILGTIGHRLHASSTDVSWVLTANLLAAAVLTPLLGRLGDQLGKKKVLVASMIVLVAGSLLAATTSSLGLLITARALQGVGTAIFPLAIGIARDEIRPAKLPGAMALISATLSVGGGVGLVATGLLIQGDNPDYHRVFWLATALAALALVAVVALVPAGTRAKVASRVDWLGAATLGATLVALLLPLSQGNSWGWTSARTLGLFAASVVLAGLWVLVERRVAAPLVDLRMFARRQVAMTNIAALLFGFAMFGMFIGASTMVQIPHALAGYGFGATVLRAAVEYLLPSSLVSVLAAPLGGLLVRRIGAKAVLALGTVTGVVGFSSFALWHEKSWQVIAAVMISGVAISLGYAAMPALIVAAVPVEQTGIANGLNSIARTVGSSVASAVVTTLLTSRLVVHKPFPPLPAESGFTLTFWLCAGACALAALVTLIGVRGNTHSEPPHVVALNDVEALPELAGAGRKI
ncbi:MFS transporter [Longispora fulva]|nr:MFS transporter [Longispora fulva]